MLGGGREKKEVAKGGSLALFPLLIVIDLDAVVCLFNEFIAATGIIS